MKKIMDFIKAVCKLAYKVFTIPGVVPPKASWKRISAAASVIIAFRQLAIGDKLGFYSCIGYSVVIAVVALITKS